MSEVVECHSGYDYADRPTAFHWEGVRKVIEEVLDSWRTPEGKCFRVKTSDLKLFELCYDQASEDWIIQPREY